MEVISNPSPCLAKECPTDDLKKLKEKESMSIELPLVPEEFNVQDFTYYVSPPQAEVCLGADLENDEIAFIESLNNWDDVRNYLKTIFPELEDHEKNPQNDILLELYLYALKTSSNYRLNNVQTSAFFSILKKTHEFWTYAPFAYLNDVFKYFKDLLICHSVHDPPKKICIFRGNKPEQLMREVIRVYFRHAPLFKYCSVPQMHLDFNLVKTGPCNLSKDGKNGRLLNVVLGPTDLKAEGDGLPPVPSTNNEHLLEIYQELSKTDLKSERPVPGSAYQMIQKAVGPRDNMDRLEPGGLNDNYEYLDTTDTDNEDCLILPGKEAGIDLISSPNTTTSFPNSEDEPTLSDSEGVKKHAEGKSQVSNDLLATSPASKSE